MKKEYFLAGLVIVGIILYYAIGPGCPQKAFLGVSCPGCGMTRAYLQLLQGNIRGAFSYHPAFWIVPIAGGLLLFRRKFPKMVFQAGMAVIALVFFAVYFYRMSCHDPVLIFDFRQGYVYKIWEILSVRFQ